jgi:dUTP pyrophosphatase
MSTLKVLKLSDNAFTPTKGSAEAAGYDLFAASDFVVVARGKCIVPTDLSILVPEGTYGRIAPRSGLAVNNFVHVGAGVIDRDYRGNIGVVLFNHADNEFSAKKGDIIAQLICEKIEYPKLEEVYSLEVTTRRDGGFGSTDA